MKQLSEMSVEELNQQQKSIKFVTGVMIGALIAMGAIGVFLTFQKGFSVFTILPVCFLPLAIINFKKLKEIREELRLRE